MFTSAIVVAAGSGVRLGGRVPKAMVAINSRPAVIYSLDVLSRHPGIREIILVVNSTMLLPVSSAIKKYRIKRIKSVVLGGARRQDSVLNGLRAVAVDSQLVLVHDAARPFINKAMVSALIKEAKKSQAAIAAVPVKNTVKESVVRRSSFVVRRTIDRQNLWEVQTPQVFKKSLLLSAYKRFGKGDVTDDAMLVEKMGRPVKIVPGAYSNIKITTPEDLVIAEAIARRCGKE